MKVRYIRESMTGSNSNSGCHWCEIQAINYEGTNVALNKTVTCAGGTYEKGTLDMITNGNTSVDDYIYFRNDAQNTISVIIDLEDIADIDLIKVWHYWSGGRIYKNILLETSLDGVSWVKVFNSNEDGEYSENEEGKIHKLEDDRLPVLGESSPLNEVTSFYEKYVEQNLLSKEVLKNNLIAKGVDCSDTDKLLSLINKVDSIVIEKHNFPIFLNSFLISTLSTYSFMGFCKKNESEQFCFVDNEIYLYNYTTNTVSLVASTNQSTGYGRQTMGCYDGNNSIYTHNGATQNTGHCLYNLSTGTSTRLLANSKFETALGYFYTNKGNINLSSKGFSIYNRDTNTWSDLTNNFNSNIKSCFLYNNCIYSDIGNNIKIYDIENGNYTDISKPSKFTTVSSLIGIIENRLYCFCSDKNVYICDLKTGKWINRVVFNSSATVKNMSFSIGNILILQGSFDGISGFGIFFEK